MYIHTSYTNTHTHSYNLIYIYIEKLGFYPAVLAEIG
jgi:hypothetical protein